MGVITSPTGAAIRDILTVLRRRFPAIEVIVLPVKVQGTEAPGDIIRALRLANRLRNCDVLIVGRGGGSSEDLLAFNDEGVARAIFASRIPVISAVGHEIDFTISDFVADLRAPTPSAAAEAVSPDRSDWLERLDRLESRLRQAQINRFTLAIHRTRFLERRLLQQHPAQRLLTQSQRLDELEQRLNRGWRQRLQNLEQRLARQQARLRGSHPTPRIHLLAARAGQLDQRLQSAMRRGLELGQHQVARIVQELQAVSPLATLARGYSITRREDTGAILYSAEDVAPGTRLRTRLGTGELVSRVEADE